MTANADETLPATTTAPVVAERFAVGSMAAGRYRIDRYIASGGMGEVYAAHDVMLDAKVALKTLRPELEGSSDAVARLRREMALARSVTDSHVCRLYDVGEHDGRVFLSMELLVGRTLADIVKLGPLPIAEVERLAGQLVAGLGALHRASIIHRDLKASNVIVVGEGASSRAVITDFGLARSADASGARSTLSADAGLLGTPAYMAPEQVEARPATKASDIYALGVVLFELLTGKLPFEEETAMATATARLQKDPPRPSSLRSEIPARWDAIVLRCLARDPAARFASVDEILGHRPQSRRWFLAAGGGALAATALGLWRYRGCVEQPTSTAHSPDDIVAVLPVFGAGNWLEDPWRTAITVDLHDALCSAGVRVLSIHGGAMKKTLDGAAPKLLAEADPVSAALALPNVTTVVTMTMALVAARIELVVTMTGAESWDQRRFVRPVDEVGLLVQEVATALAMTLGYAAPRMPADAASMNAELYAQYGTALSSLYRPRSEEERAAMAARKIEGPRKKIRGLVATTPQLIRATALWSELVQMEAEQQEDWKLAKQGLDEASALVERVLAIDPHNALAHAVRGGIAMATWDWKLADVETARGVELAPTHARVSYHRSMFLYLAGRFDEGLAHAEAYHALNPRPKLGSSTLFWHYFYARRFDEVIRTVEPILDRLDLTDWYDAIHASLLPMAYVEQSRFDDAIRIADKIRPHLDNYSLSGLVGVYLAAGRVDDAKAIRAKIGTDVDLAMQALMADAFGEIDTALTQLEAVVAAHNIAATFLKIERLSPQLRSHPRFQALLKTVGFP